MAIYLNESFDHSVMPAGWSTLGTGTFAESNTQSYYGAGHYSLKITAGSAQTLFLWNPNFLDTNFGAVQLSYKFFYDTTPTSGFIPVIYLLCTSGPSGSNKPPYSLAAFFGLNSGGSDAKMNSNNSTGASATNLTNSITNATFVGAFAANNWYQFTFQTNQNVSGSYYYSVAYIQRLSDNAWLHRNGTFQTGAQTAFLLNSGAYPNTNFSGWYAGTFPTMALVTYSGINFYLNDFVFQSAQFIDYVDGTTSSTTYGFIPANPPAAGNEVELIPTITASDGTVSGQPLSKLNSFITGIGAPVQSSPSTSTTGGTLAAGTYYYVLTSTNASGETVAGNQTFITTTGTTSTVTLNWSAVTGATGYKIYRSTTAGSYGSSSLLTTIASGATVTYTDTGTALTSGTPPSVRSTVVSSQSWDDWLLLDSGAGNALQATALLFSPAWYTSSSVVYDETSLGLAVEGATSSGGPWTALGAWSQAEYPQAQYLNTLRLDPSTPGGTYRYFRVRAPLDPYALSQLYLHVNNSSLGTASWKPTRPILSPAAGNVPSGTTVTITCATTGATIFYTTDGSTPSQSGGSPTGTTQTYSGPVTLPTNAPSATVLKAMAYHASGTTTTSAVATGNYLVATNAEIIFDSGVTGATTFGTTFSQAQNFPGPLYDCVTGNAINAHDGCIFYDGGTPYWIGSNVNTPFLTSYGVDGQTTMPRGIRLYQGVSVNGAPAWANWKYLTTIIPPPSLHWFGGAKWGNQSREKLLINPNPLDPNKKYVLWYHIGTGSVANDGYMVFTSPALTGPWTAQSYQNAIGSLSGYGDVFLFYDVVDDGTGHSRNKAWIFFVDNTTQVLYCFQLDPATDWTSTTGAGFIVPMPTNYEGIVVFYQGGYYYVLGSAPTAYGAGNCRVEYISNTTLQHTGWSAAAVIYSGGAPSAPSVAYSSQPYGIVQIPGLVANGYLLLLTVQDAFESTIDSSHMYNAILPVSSITSGNAVNAFPSAGTLAIPNQLVWDQTYLPSVAVLLWGWQESDTMARRRMLTENRQVIPY